jgi:hypothetical protein
VAIVLVLVLVRLFVLVYSRDNPGENAQLGSNPSLNELSNELFLLLKRSC